MRDRYLVRIRRAMLIVGALSLAGCDAEVVFAAPEQLWAWFAIPFGAFLIFGGTLVSVLRRAQIRRWDLRKAPTDAGVQGLVLWTVGIAIVLTVVFVVYHVPLEIDPKQKLFNGGAWAVGSLLGAVLGLLWGLRLAEPRSLTHDEGSS